MKRRIFTLSQRIALLIVLGLAANSLLVIDISGRVLETSTFHQLQKQALLYLLEIERQIQMGRQPGSPAHLQAVIDKSTRPPQQYDFSISRLYIYDREGNILADSKPGDRSKPDMSGRYSTVVLNGEPYLGKDIEYHPDPGKKDVPITDIIIPLTVDGKIIGGMEIELDLTRNMELARSLDDRYQAILISAIGALTLVILLFFWWVILRGLIKPISALHAVTATIAEGNLDSRSNIRSGDELGELGESVNRMAENIQQLIREQHDAYLQVLQTLAMALEKKDGYTANHSERVRNYAVMLAKHCGLPEKEIDILRQGALLHDLGKIGIPDAVLNKSGALTEAEYALIKSHPMMTAEIMRPLKHFNKHAEIGASHHERWDGKGYPDGLKGEAIPLLARIVAIADTWDAMTGDRVYRRGMPFSDALDRMDRERDHGQFDPSLLDVFIGMMRQGNVIRDDFEENDSIPAPGIHYDKDHIVLPINGAKLS